MARAVGERAWREWDESIAADEARRRPRGFDARRALRAAGLETRELGDGFAKTGATVADDLGSRLRTESFGAVLISAGAALVGLILLDLALSPRGAGGLSRIMDAAGSGVRKLVDPYEPIIAGVEVKPTAAQGDDPSSNDDGGDGPRREAPGAPQLTSFLTGGALFAPLSSPLPRSSSYGVADGPEGVRSGSGYIHGGLDWFAAAGAAVFAPFAGRVIEARQSADASGQVFGGTVKLQDARTGLVFVARHVDPAVQVGDTLGAGAPIARVADWQGGSPHAHIELWKSSTGGYVASNLLDPFLFLVPKGV